MMNSTRRAYTIGLGIAIAGVLFPFLVFGQQPATDVGVTPDGWYVYPERKLLHLDQYTRRCFNYSHNDWEVSSDGDAIRITKQVSHKGDPQNELPLPPRLKFEPGMPGRTVDAGLRSATHFGNAWLLAYDAGEWGGGLWLSNEDGSETRRVISDNVHAVVPIDGGFLVLSGLAHMSLDFGNAYIFSNPDGLNIPLRNTVRLDGEPRGYAKTSDGSVFFVTTRGLSKMTKSGELQNLSNFPDWTRHQYATSMAIASDGSIFVAMRMFVLRLRPIVGKYDQEWLLPSECRTFELKQTDCVCKP
jgi:hypothetical protein